MKKILFATLVVAAMASCSDDAGTGAVGDYVAAQFQSGIATRAIDNVWQEGDKIGVYATPQTSTYATDVYENIPHEVAAAGEVQPFSSTTAIYFPMDNSYVDFFAYYPYTDAITADYQCPIDVTEQADPALIDFMTSTLISDENGTVYYKRQPDVAFNFAHRLSRFSFTTINGDGVSAEDMATLTVSIEGHYTTAMYDMATDTIVLQGDIAAITPRTIAVGESYDAIMIPATAMADAKVIFTIPAYGDLIWDISAIEMEEGVDASYEITITRTRIESELNTINSWNPEVGTNDGLDAE